MGTTRTGCSDVEGRSGNAERAEGTERSHTVLVGARHALPLATGNRRPREAETQRGIERSHPFLVGATHASPLATDDRRPGETGTQGTQRGERAKQTGLAPLATGNRRPTLSFSAMLADNAIFG
jgi:hypothetical protein